jgi:hypothetical protein
MAAASRILVAKETGERGCRLVARNGHDVRPALRSRSGSRARPGCEGRRRRHRSGAPARRRAKGFGAGRGDRARTRLEYRASRHLSRSGAARSCCVATSLIRTSVHRPRVRCATSRACAAWRTDSIDVKPHPESSAARHRGSHRRSDCSVRRASETADPRLLERRRHLLETASRSLDAHGIAADAIEPTGNSGGGGGAALVVR